MVARRPEGADVRQAGWWPTVGALTVLAAVGPARAEDGPKAVAAVEGTAATGSVVRLIADGSRGQGLHIRWFQTRGAPVQFDDPASRSPRFTVPESTAPLGFTLVVANADGVDSTTLTVPIVPRPRAASTTLRADAGDDQIGIVGHQITLNGNRSAPRGTIGYRWIQTAGPGVRLKLEEGYIYTFVPTEPGDYRFALVVASGSEISEPDEVEVSVSAGNALPDGARASSSHPPSPAPRIGPETVLATSRAALASFAEGPPAAEPLALTFEAIASKMDLYRTYADVFQEMSRRLEGIVPADQARRAVWVERFFNPLSASLVEAMRPEGLDLRQPSAQSSPLSAAQKARLAELLRALAEGARQAGGGGGR